MMRTNKDLSTMLEGYQDFFSMLEFSQVRGGEQVWTYSYFPTFKLMCWSLPPWMKGLLPYTFELGNRS